MEPITNADTSDLETALEVLEGKLESGTNHIYIGTNGEEVAQYDSKVKVEKVDPNERSPRAHLRWVGTKSDIEEELDRR